jgi:hypothetical protein
MACRSWEFYDFSEIAKKKRGRMAKLTSAVIVNLTEQSWTLHRSYGAYRIRGCENGEPYALTRVEARTAYMDLGDKRTMEIPISAVEVAEDLCREINSDAGEESNLGVFVAKGEMPTSEELRKGRERLAAFYRRLVAGADREWERSHSYLFINDVERRAAHYLGIEKDWFYQPREMVECPACGEKIKPGVAVCRTCGAILDRTKAASLGLAPPNLASAATSPAQARTPAPAVRNS